jgi:hypothetical protein
MKRHTLEQIDACLEGSLDEEGFASLQQELRENPDALDHYCRQAEIHGRLQWELGEPAQSLFREATPAQRLPLPFSLKLAAAAVLALSALFTFHLTRPATTAGTQAPPAPESATLGRITRSLNAEWASHPHEPGDWIGPGTFRLTAGSVEITFDCGATVLIEGNSTLTLSSPTRARLESGKATVDIPAQARGFVLETPSTLLSQHNSRFGVAVDGDGSAEVHVLQGRVELNGKWGDLSSLMLGKNKPVRVNRQGILLAGERYRADQFPVRPPPGPELLPAWYLHWSFDTAATTRDTFRDSGPRPPQMPTFPAEVRLTGTQASVSLIPGRFGNAVQFNGNDAFLATAFPGIAGNSPRTIAFWIRIPEDTSELFAYSILSWGTPQAGGKWQIGWNTGFDNSGLRGAIRTEVQGGFQIGSTNLVNGRWHHVAIVFPGGADSSNSRHIRHYINGTLEPSTALKSHPVNTRIDGSSALPLSIGRRIESDAYFRTFKGDLDELYILPTALTPEQIQALHDANSPPATR